MDREGGAQGGHAVLREKSALQGAHPPEGNSGFGGGPPLIYYLLSIVIFTIT